VNSFRSPSCLFASIVFTFLASVSTLGQGPASHQYVYKINGMFMIDGVRYTCSGPSIQQALADAVAVGGGTVDARGCPTLTSGFTSETDVADANGSSPVVLLLPNAGHWISHIVNPSAYMLRLYSKGVAMSAGGVGEGSPFVWGIDEGSIVDSVCGNDPNGAYYHLEGFQCYAGAGSRVTNAILHIFNAEDQSIATRMVAVSKSADVSKIVWFHGSCCTASMTYINAETDFLGSGIPCYFGPNNHNVTAAQFSCVHPISGTNNAVVEQSQTQFSNYYGPIYMEWADGFSDATTPGMAVTGSSAIMDFIEPKCGADGVIGSDSRYCISIGSGTTVHLYRPQSSNSSRYLIEDNNIGQNVILGFAGATIPDYSAKPLSQPVRSPLIPVNPKENTTISSPPKCLRPECNSERPTPIRRSGYSTNLEGIVASGTLTLTSMNTIGCVDAAASASGAVPGNRVVVSPVSPQKDTQWSGYVSKADTINIRVCTITPLTGNAVTYSWSVLP
jgi:hypothetical protein